MCAALPCFSVPCNSVDEMMSAVHGSFLYVPWEVLHMFCSLSFRFFFLSPYLCAALPCFSVPGNSVDEMMSAVHSSCFSVPCNSVDEFVSMCAALPCFSVPCNSVDEMMSAVHSSCFAVPISVPLMSSYRCVPRCLAFPFPAIPLMR